MMTLAQPTCSVDSTGASTLSDMVKRVILGIQEFRLNMADRIDALGKGEDTIVQRRGRIVGALISIEDYREWRKFKGEPTDL